jgi:hypothetical protein
MGSERPKMVTVVDRKTGARRLVKGVGFGFDETSHPRYPKGHPKGGKWMQGKGNAGGPQGGDSQYDGPDGLKRVAMAFGRTMHEGLPVADVDELMAAQRQSGGFRIDAIEHPGNSEHDTWTEWVHVTLTRSEVEEALGLARDYKIMLDEYEEQMPSVAELFTKPMPDVPTLLTMSARANRLEQIMLHDEVGGRLKFVGSSGTGVRVVRDAAGAYTVWHIEDNGRTHNPSPIVENGTAEDAAKEIGNASADVLGARLSLGQKRDVDELIWGNHE